MAHIEIAEIRIAADQSEAPRIEIAEISIVASPSEEADES